MQVEWKVGVLWFLFFLAVGCGRAGDGVAGSSPVEPCQEGECDDVVGAGDVVNVTDDAGDAETRMIVDEVSSDVDEDVADDAFLQDVEPVDSSSDVQALPEWGEPVEALPEVWTWVDFPETHCADGSPTGLAINLHPGATRALIYFEGGGACWNFNNCFGLIQTSFHLDGYDESDFEGLLATVYLEMPLFDRESGENPFADAHHVFIPYCTGDAFAGDHVAVLDGWFPWESDTIYFKGHHNLQEYLSRLVPTFADVNRIYAAGASAGGFGVGLNWLTLSDAFSPIPVDVIDDSGPPVEPAEGRWKEWQEAWNIPLPPDCADCHESLGALVEYFRETLLSNGRLALMGYSHDTIISVFFGILPFDFAAALAELCALLDEEPNAQYFIVAGGLHTLTIVGMELVQAEDGTKLMDWLKQMVDEDPAWSSHGP